MKVWLNSLLVLMFAWTITVFSQEISVDKQAHLNARLQQETEYLKSSITEKKGEELIEDLDYLTGIGTTDRELFELLEVELEKSFSRHIANRKDKLEARVLNSMIRAYASMGYPESEEWVVKLREESKSRGVRNRAHRLVRKISWFNERNKQMNKPEFYEPQQELMTHRYLGLIHSGTSTSMRWAAEEINRNAGAEPVVYDAMRIILKNEMHSVEGDIHLDALAWFCKILKKYDLDNSKELLQSIAKDPKTHKKLVKYAAI